MNEINHTMNIDIDATIPIECLPIRNHFRFKVYNYNKNT